MSKIHKDPNRIIKTRSPKRGGKRGTGTRNTLCAPYSPLLQHLKPAAQDRVSVCSLLPPRLSSRTGSYHFLNTLSCLAASTAQGPSA